MAVGLGNSEKQVIGRAFTVKVLLKCRCVCEKVQGSGKKHLSNEF